MAPRTVLLLLLMSLLGVFPLDVILPSFPALATTFDVDISDIALSISLFAVSVGLSQSLIGPLSDVLGRKRLLMAGLIIAIAGAQGCRLATEYPAFIACRIIQALGCGCFVLSQALVQDIFNGAQRNRMRILLASASGVFISLSPLAGSVLQGAFGWTASFSVFTGLAIGALWLCSITLPSSINEPLVCGGILHSYRVLARDRGFLAYCALSAMAFACHFSFIVTSPLLLMQLLELSEYEFSLVFIGYGAAYITCGVVAGAINTEVTVNTQIGIGLALIGSAGLLLRAWLLVEELSVTAVLLAMMVCTAGTTIIRPAATTCALERHPERAGAAAALNNTLLFATGGAASGLIALVDTGLPLNLALAFIVISLSGAFILRLLACHRTHWTSGRKSANPPR
ncbi:Inner membrane transport protein YdhC [Pseudomonas fluorescens]|uniref:MFS transporter n=1 Tax=Pseudomonas fluorescens TaxID=294 RepID=UPI0012534EEA|nr:MFS transporter [Pseudomonas fluorescens]CAG8864454.1 Inner membrane transport protein YdhC [Pseudomonas fluorescens]VVP72879.1 Inner membrane transport protein YdhC [Pseudomonas fluorescens]